METQITRLTSRLPKIIFMMKTIQVDWCEMIAVFFFFLNLPTGVTSELGITQDRCDSPGSCEHDLNSWPRWAEFLVILQTEHDQYFHPLPCGTGCFVAWFRGFVAPLTQILIWKNLGKRRRWLHGGDCLPALTWGQNSLLPGEASCESDLASVSFSQGLLQGLVSPLSFLVAFYFLHSLHSFPPSLPPCISCSAHCLAVKSPSVFNSFLIFPPFTAQLWKSIMRLRQTSAI